MGTEVVGNMRLTLTIYAQIEISVPHTITIYAQVEAALLDLKFNNIRAGEAWAAHSSIKKYGLS